jgi:hypothetical protein
VKKTAENAILNLKNPFSEVSQWITGELLDMSNLLNALDCVENINSHRKKDGLSAKEIQEEIEKISSGSFSFSILFKSRQEIESQVVAMEK